MASSTPQKQNQSKDGEIFENVEFVEPEQKAMQQPSHSHTQPTMLKTSTATNNETNRKRKEHPSSTVNDVYGPPTKRAKISHNDK